MIMRAASTSNPTHLHPGARDSGRGQPHCCSHSRAGGVEHGTGQRPCLLLLHGCWASGLRQHRRQELEPPIMPGRTLLAQLCTCRCWCILIIRSGWAAWLHRELNWAVIIGGSLTMASLSSITDLAKENQGAALAIGGAGALAALGYLYTRSSRGNYKRSPSSFEISGGAVDAKKVKDTVRAGGSCTRQLGHRGSLLAPVNAAPPPSPPCRRSRHVRRRAQALLGEACTQQSNA